MTERRIRLFIEGLVQGVGFRAFVEREAQARGLDGWVRNRRDARVEAVVSGPSTLVDEFAARCRQGPRGSRVDRIDVMDETAAVAPGFTVLPTA